ncbi:hypothetical protein V6N11_010871 [Hibiscus sabdariffa]|uniref:Uncharacterized protein n=1 Tax=Hibiscus sabdariffa TaxID=183260 RepID=A0ABR2S7B2_9ROSI
MIALVTVFGGQHRNMNATGPNGPIGMNASHSNGSEGVSFSWDDGVVDEGSYERQENSGDSNWLGGGLFLSDDDDDEEIASIKKLDENETNRNEKARDEDDGNEADGNEEARDEQRGNEADENEVDLVGLCSGEETKYLDSLDVGSYETNTDGDIISKKIGQVFFILLQLIPNSNWE